MWDRRGQQIGEYAVLIGIVATAFVGSQLYMSRRIAGSLIAVSTTVLGPPAADTGTNTSTTDSAVNEIGNAAGIHTQILSNANGNSTSGNVLAEAFGPYLGLMLINNSSGTTIPLGALSLPGFTSPAITDNPNWMMDHAKGRDKVEVRDRNQDGAREILALDPSTMNAYLPQQPDGLPNLLAFDSDQVVYAINASGASDSKDASDPWRAASKVSRAKALVTYLDSSDWDQQVKDIKDGKVSLPDAKKKLDPTDENRRYEAFKAIYMNLQEEEKFDGTKHDPLEQKLKRIAGYNIEGELGKVDISRLSIKDVESMLEEARNPNSGLAKQLAADGVLGDAGPATTQVKREIRDSQGNVVMSLEAGGDLAKDWKTEPGSKYDGTVVYTTIKTGDKDVSVPYGIQAAKDPKGKLEFRFGTFEADLTGGSPSIDVVAETTDGGKILEEPVTSRRTFVGGFDESGHWNPDVTSAPSDDPVLIPYVSQDSTDRRPKGWLYSDGKFQQDVKDGTYPKGTKYLFIADTNQNGQWDAGEGPTAVVMTNWKDIVPGKETPKNVLQTDVPTGAELLAAGMTPQDLKHVVLYRRFKPDSVPEDARGSVPSGITRNDLTKTITAEGRGSLSGLARAVLIAALVNATFTEVKNGDEEDRPSIMRPQLLQDLVGSKADSGANGQTPGQTSNSLNLGGLQNQITNDINRAMPHSSAGSAPGASPERTRP